MKSRFTYWLTMVAGGVALSAAILAATDGPLTPWGNLRGRTDNNGYVMVSAGTPGTTDGPLTLFPQLRTRTDENGYLRVALSGGAVIPSANCYGWSTDTFLQRVAAANVGVSATCGGANTGTFTGGVLATGDGTVSAPSLKFASDTNVGWYRRGANEWNWSYAGSERYRIGVNFEFGGPLNVGNTTLGFSTGIGATPDVTFGRTAASAVQLLGAASADVAVFKAKTLQNSAGPFANCNAAPVEGMLCAITDSLTAVWGATITDGGANHVLGYYNGTNWTVAAK